MSRQWIVPGIVVGVHDGDTVTLDLDLGWYLTSRQHVRVAHINAPELAAPGGAASRDRLRELLPVGTLVVLVSTGLDKYGRSLGVITPVTPAGALDVGTVLLAEGLASAYEGGKR